MTYPVNGTGRDPELDHVTGKMVDDIITALAVSDLDRGKGTADHRRVMLATKSTHIFAIRLRQAASRRSGGPKHSGIHKKLRPGFGGSLAAREPVWDGEGWGCDRVAGS